jgi:hypothetical protein
MLSAICGASLTASDYFLPPLIFAHRARCEAAIFRLAATDIVRWRRVALPGWPLNSARSLAQRARAAAAIRVRPAAEILGRGLPIDPPRLTFIALSALIAASRAFSCLANLSRSTFSCATMSMCSAPAVIVAKQSLATSWPCILIGVSYSRK